MLFSTLFLSLLTAQTPSRFLALDTVLQGEDLGDLRFPVGVAVASPESVGVVDTFGNRLVMFALKSGAWEADKTATLPSSPRAVAHDGGRFAVSVSDGRLLAVEGDDLGVSHIVLPPGTLPGALATRFGGGLLVHDRAGAKVLALDGDGRVIGESPGTGSIKALFSAPDGGFYTALPASAEIRRHGADGTVLRTWSVPGLNPVPAWPSGLIAEPGGDVVVVDRHGGRILAFDAAGRLVGVGSGRGWGPGELIFPGAIAQFPDGKLIVVDQGNSRVQIFRPVESVSTP
jgi:hypothetical protein